jgi:hypothetical protein
MPLHLRRDKRELPEWCASLYILITVLTVQDVPETATASLRRHYPWAIKPGRRVADMLLVSTFQLRHPILRFILMKTNDHALHGGLPCALEA